jgi:5'-deoxynucleotidase YfbR-like HD superfamily hydrolase
MSSVKALIKFQTLLKKYNSIYRDCGSIHKLGQQDNDVEHSFRVAMLSWMIIDEYKLKLDINKVIRYSLVHDLPEIYAGDHSIHFTYNQKEVEKKEALAIKKLAKQFPKQKSIWKDLVEYEKRKDPESRFVYLIEKLEPVLIMILSGKNPHKARKIKLDDFIEKKQRKIKDLDSIAQFINKDVMNYLKKNRKRFE